MSFFQKVGLFLTLMFQGTKLMFSFSAGANKYQVVIGYSASHQVLDRASVMAAIEAFLMNAQTLPYTVTVGNVVLTISQVV